MGVWVFGNSLKGTGIMPKKQELRANHAKPIQGR